MKLKCQSSSYSMIILLVFITMASLLSIVHFQLNQFFFIPVFLFAIITPIFISINYLVIKEELIYLKPFIGKGKDLSGATNMSLNYIRFTNANGIQVSFMTSGGKKYKITFSENKKNAQKLEIIIRHLNAKGGIIHFKSDSKKGYYAAIRKNLGATSNIIEANSL